MCHSPRTTNGGSLKSWTAAATSRGFSRRSHPIAWKGTVVQYAGRLHRNHPLKRDLRIYDYVAAEVPVLRRMYAKRLRTYREMGYVCDQSAHALSLTV
jgi:hypothetical protein